ncbi:luciferin 4-monooxygenase [Prorops nasuta]|uniref:luciferin 4-monooxygenase n=1 Tax=Prorops nasuta TaxID=863751 RepID=UPI0034CE3C3D
MELKMQNESNILHGPPLSALLQIDKGSLGELLIHKIAEHKTKVAQINAHTNEERTFKQIYDDTRKLAIFLKKDGVKMDDRLAICSENNLNFCIPVCATFYLGCAICPLNPLYTERELEHSLCISKPKYIFISPMASQVVQKVANKLSWSPKLVLLYDNPTVNLPTMKNLISNISKDEMNEFKITKIMDIKSHVAAILCSSGTTGLPKGVMLTDKNYFTIFQHLMQPELPFARSDRNALGLLPFFHTYAFTVMIVLLLNGATNVILSRFEEKLFLETIQNYKIQNLTLVPPLMTFLAKHPLVDQYDLSSVQNIWCGAAPLSEALQRAVVNRLNITEIRQAYGLTESSLAVTSSPPGKFKYGSVGVLVSGISGKVVPIDKPNCSTPLGPYRQGELCFKGDLIMKGYCNNKNATDATIDKDGWLHTGDIGYYDEDGFFFIVDRIKELIKYKGFQVPPAELEAVLLTCLGIKDAAVIGVPNEEVGELPMAFVVKDNTCNITANEIHKYLAERVSSHKRLRGGIKFVDNIPKTASGKILRRDLRNMVKSNL